LCCAEVFVSARDHFCIDERVSMRYYEHMRFLAFGIVLVAAGGLFFAFQSADILIIQENPSATTTANTSSTLGDSAHFQVEKNYQEPLQNPPDIIRAVYLTSWSGGSSKRIAQIKKLIKETPLNAVVIDVKDYTGLLAYKSSIPFIKEHNLYENRIPDVASLVEDLHRDGIYVIARITVFQDPALVHAQPDVAVKQMVASSTPDTYPIWEDRKGLSWADPASHEVWDYIIAIAKEVQSFGFDELNFDYIRFPSDGDIFSMHFPHWDKTKPRHEVIKNFFSYLREQLPDSVISADLFGLVTVAQDDIGIGQILEDAYSYFDYVSPMVYPSHYANGSFGYAHPAKNPYEIVSHSISVAHDRLFPTIQVPTHTGSSTASTTEYISKQDRDRFKAKLRPWLQDFDLGADYTASMIQAQILAVHDALGEDYAGYMLWAPSNVYTEGGAIE